MPNSQNNRFFMNLTPPFYLFSDFLSCFSYFVSSHIFRLGLKLRPQVRGVIKKYHYFQISCVTCVKFSRFFLLWWCTCPWLYWQYKPFWIGSLFLTDIKGSHVVLFNFYFLLFEKNGSKDTGLSFVLKKYIKCDRTFELLIVVFGRLWAEHKFNCGITGLSKAEKISVTMLGLLFAQARQQGRLFQNWNIFGKTTAHGHRKGDVDDFLRRSKFAQKG